MHRALVAPVEAGRAVLSPEETHHLVRVLRARPGDPFVALDGRGHAYRCRLERDGSVWFGRVVDELEERRESPLRVTLAQSLIKKDKFEWVIQKCVELGVADIVPLITRRTEVLLQEASLEHRMTRWRKIMAEAFKQSRRTILPRLAEPVELAGYLASATADLRFALDEQEGVHLKELIRSHRQARSCLFFVGPEGGWDARDRDVLRAQSVASVHLGWRVLRTETAPVAALSVLQYELGDLGPDLHRPISGPEPC